MARDQALGNVVSNQRMVQGSSKVAQLEGGRTVYQTGASQATQIKPLHAEWHQHPGVVMKGTMEGILENYWVHYVVDMGPQADSTRNCQTKTFLIQWRFPRLNIEG